MQTKIQKWGNSLGIRIPSHLAQQLHLHAGSIVGLDIENERLVIQPPQYNLDDMLAEIKPKNRHHILLDDAAQGEEAW